MKQPLFTLTKQALVNDIAKQSPKAAALLHEYGLHCMHCFFNQYDTLEAGARLHGMTEDEMQEMIEEINKELQEDNNHNE